jgi:hypothetical protein
MSVVLFGCFSQCYLSKVSTNLVLTRANGILLTINGLPNVIPVAGVSLAPTELTPGTTYNIYAYMNCETMTLEASATAWVIDTESGLPVKSGDASRTLVGKARVVSGPAWQDGGARIFVLSYFNRRKKTAKNALPATTTTTSTSFVELDATNGRTEWLTWGDANVDVSSTGTAIGNSVANAIVGVGIDGTTATGSTVTLANSGGSGSTPFIINAPYSLLTSLNPGDVAEGYHYSTILMASNPAIGDPTVGIRSGADAVPPNNYSGIQTSVMG